MNLTEWARSQGVHPKTAHRWFREIIAGAGGAGDQRTVLVNPDAADVLTSFCARLYGRRSARNRAIKAVGGVQRNIEPKFVGVGREDERHG